MRLLLSIGARVAASLGTLATVVLLALGAVGSPAASVSPLPPASPQPSGPVAQPSAAASSPAVVSEIVTAREAAVRAARVAAPHRVTAAPSAPRAPRARPIAPTRRVWTSGFQAQIDACRGAVDLTRAYGVATIGEKWGCGGSTFPKSGTVTLTGVRSGTYRVGPVVAVRDAYTARSGSIPRGYDLLYQTCRNGNARTVIFVALARTR